MQAWRGFMQRHYPEGDVTDAGNVFGHGIAATMVQALRQCGRDLTRERLIQEAANLKALDLDVLLPGIRVDTAPTNSTRSGRCSSRVGPAPPGSASATSSRVGRGADPVSCRYISTRVPSSTTRAVGMPK